MGDADAQHVMALKSSTSKSSDNSHDVQLMQRVKEGGPSAQSAFAALVERHQYAVVGTVGKMLGGSPEAEDIAQQVFLRLWKSAPRYKPTAQFTTYLFTITKNLVFNETRRRKNRKIQSLEAQGEEWGRQYPDQTGRNPAEAATDEELRRHVDRAIASLPEKQRLALTLRRYQELPYEEIAKILKMSVSALKSQLFRARETLKKELETYLK